MKKSGVLILPTLTINEINIHYDTKGDGIPIIFIHPPLLTSTIFKFQLEHFSKKYKVITFDIRGHGKSDYSDEPITYPLIVEDIVALLDELNIEKAFICGYSTGGSIVLEFLLQHPERAFGGIVISGMSEVKDRILKLRLGAAINLSNDKTIPFLTYMVTRGNANSSQTFNSLRKGAKEGHSINIKQYYLYSRNYNCTKFLQEIQHPVLLTYGAKNKTFHQYAQLLHENLPHNELIFIENAKHQIPTKEPKKLHDAIHRFIQSYKRE